MVVVVVVVAHDALLLWKSLSKLANILWRPIKWTAAVRFSRLSLSLPFALALSTSSHNQQVNGVAPKWAPPNGWASKQAAAIRFSPELSYENRGGGCSSFEDDDQRTGGSDLRPKWWWCCCLKDSSASLASIIINEKRVPRLFLLLLLLFCKQRHLQQRFH